MLYMDDSFINKCAGSVNAGSCLTYYGGQMYASSSS